MEGNQSEGDAGYGRGNEGARSLVGGGGGGGGREDGCAEKSGGEHQSLTVAKVPTGCG